MQTDIRACRISQLIFYTYWRLRFCFHQDVTLFSIQIFHQSSYVAFARDIKG